MSSISQGSSAAKEEGFPPASPDRMASTATFETTTHPPAPSAQVAAASDRAVAGQVIGDYELIDRLGVGGMGVVYRARQRSANRIVALKLIRPERLEDLEPEKRQKWLDRFQTEAQATARLQHDHIVTVYEVGQLDGVPFYSMRYIEGRSLADTLRDGPLENRRAAAYLEPVARAVDYAHRAGILHRDLKPRNILVDSSDRPYVTDFGLAKWVAPESHGVTRTGEIMGTPEYMSPEQATDSARVKAASDVYSLGATLYDLLTGRSPFRAATPLETLRQVTETEPVAPRQLNPAIDRDLETITLKCLEKEPARRYSSAGALADDLRRYLKGEPILARPVSAPERFWRWSRRHPGAAAAIAAVGLAAVVLAGATAVVSGKNEQLARANLNLDQTNQQLSTTNDRLELAIDGERQAKDDAEAKRKDEQHAREQAMDALRSLTDDVVEQQMARRVQLTEEDRDFLRKILKHYESFAATRGDSAESRSIRAEGFARVGLVRFRLGELEDAETAYRDALKLYKQLARISHTR